MTETERALRDGAREMGLALEQEAAHRFLLFTQELLRANETVNLTAVTDPLEIVSKHYLDSLAPVAKGLIPHGARVIDVGCGAGFPGLPIRIIRPDVSLCLLDATGKRIHFLEQALVKMELSGIRLVHGRAEEEAGKKEHREGYDVALARAVAGLPVLCELCLPFVRVGGAFVALKGPSAREEAAEAKNAVSVLGGRVSEVSEIFIPGIGTGHQLIVIQKVQNTDTKYPRSFSKITKSPL